MDQLNIIGEVSSLALVGNLLCGRLWLGTRNWLGLHSLIFHELLKHCHHGILLFALGLLKCIDFSRDLRPDPLCRVLRDLFGCVDTMFLDEFNHFSTIRIGHQLAERGSAHRNSLQCQAAARLVQSHGLVLWLVFFLLGRVGRVVGFGWRIDLGSIHDSSHRIFWGGVCALDRRRRKVVFVEIIDCC